MWAICGFEVLMALFVWCGKLTLTNFQNQSLLMIVVLMKYFPKDGKWTYYGCFWNHWWWFYNLLVHSISHKQSCGLSPRLGLGFCQALIRPSWAEPAYTSLGDGTMDSPFIEVASSDKPSKLDVKACMKHLKKGARCYGFRVIEVTWVISPDSSPDSSPEPQERGPNVVQHSHHPSSKFLQTVEPVFWGDCTYADVYCWKDNVDMTDPILIMNKGAIAALVNSITKNLVKHAARKWFAWISSFWDVIYSAVPFEKVICLNKNFVGIIDDKWGGEEKKSYINFIGW